MSARASIPSEGLRPRLGFAGLGWIGRDRMAAALRQGAVQPVAVADPSSDARKAAIKIAPGARSYDGFEAMLEEEQLDGVVIATPSAMHAEQAVSALDRGLAVFCQKPLGRNADETRHVVAAARERNLLLGVDFCYRHLAGMDELRRRMSDGDLGEIFHVQGTFHNAYGPGSAWFFDAAKSGGGCLIDLGIHLVDLAHWLLDAPPMVVLSAHLFANGQPFRDRVREVEDFATARIGLGAAVMDLACSWNLSLGRDVEIALRIRGTSGALVIENVNGSYYDFVVHHHKGRSTEVIAEPPDHWGGRAIGRWARQLAAAEQYDGSIESAVDIAEILDHIYTGGLRDRITTGEEGKSWQENPEQPRITTPSGRGRSIAGAFP